MRQFVPTLGLVLVSAFASPVMAQTAQQFDVLCDVEERWRDPTVYSGGSATSGVDHVEFRFRVDLVARRFCVDRCQAFFDLAEADNGSNLNLTYRPMLGDGTPLSSDREVSLNRVTGGISTSYRSGTLTVRGTGQCRREPFSGFPEAMF